jgi:hypothetical protein
MATDYNFGGDGFGEGPFGGGVFGGVSTPSIPAPIQDPVVAPIDHVSVGLSQVIKQYQNSPNFLAYLSSILSMSNDIENVLQSLLTLPNIDAVSGVNLDVIGLRVGQTRQITKGINFPYFGFQDTPNGEGFGELGDSSYGAPFAEYGEVQTETNTLNDAAYRILLRTRIIKNHSQATPENIMDALAYLFSSSWVSASDTTPMHMVLAIDRYLSPLEIAIFTTLDILPRPAGVMLDGLITYNPTNYFGFAGQVGALGFGELTSPTVGGIFAELI